MSTTQDLNTIRYGTQDGHQAIAQPIQSGVSLYIGQVAVTRAGYIIQPDTAVQSTDICWGMTNGQLDSQEAVSSPMAGGTTAGLHFAGIDTGTFYLSVGLSADALTQADVGADVYLIDGNTVGKTSGSSTRPVAGKLASIGVAQYSGLVAVTIGNSQSTGSP